MSAAALNAVYLLHLEKKKEKTNKQKENITVHHVSVIISVGDIRMKISASISIETKYRATQNCCCCCKNKRHHEALKRSFKC